MKLDGERQKFQQFTENLTQQVTAKDAAIREKDAQIKFHQEQEKKAFDFGMGVHQRNQELETTNTMLEALDHTNQARLKAEREKSGKYEEDIEQLKTSLRRERAEKDALQKREVDRILDEEMRNPKKRGRPKSRSYSKTDASEQQAKKRKPSPAPSPTPSESGVPQGDMIGASPFGSGAGVGSFTAPPVPQIPQTGRIDLTQIFSPNPSPLSSAQSSPSIMPLPFTAKSVPDISLGPTKLGTPTKINFDSVNEKAIVPVGKRRTTYWFRNYPKPPPEAIESVGDDSNDVYWNYIWELVFKTKQEIANAGSTAEKLKVCQDFSRKFQWIDPKTKRLYDAFGKYSQLERARQKSSRTFAISSLYRRNPAQAVFPWFIDLEEAIWKEAKVWQQRDNKFPPGTN